MILDDIKNANITALKEKDTLSRGIFSVLLNKVKLVEIAKREKSEELNEVDVVAILQKTIKELEDEKANYEKVANEEEVGNLKRQIEIVSKYLPQMLTQDEIYSIIADFEDKSIPSVMKTFKSEYAGKVDMRVVLEVLKKFG